MQEKKRLAVNMIAQFLSFAVGLLISFKLSPYIVKTVGTETYGFWGLANEFTGYAQIITVALNSMASRFITIKIHQEDKEGVNKYYTSVLLSNVIIAIVLLIPFTFIVLFLEHIIHISSGIVFDVKLLWAFVFVNFLVSIVLSTYGVAIFAKNRLELSAVRSIFASIMRCVFLVGCFAIFQPKIWYVGLAALLCNLYTCGWNVYYHKKLLPGVQIKPQYFDFKVVKELLSSGIWNAFSRVSNLLTNGLDLLICNMFIGGTAMGVLSISKTLPNYILSTFAILAGVFSPQLTISYAKGDFQDIKQQLLSSMKILGTISCIPMAILFAYGKNFYSLWMPSQDAQLLQLLSITCCFAFVFALPQEGLWNVFTATNKIKVTSMYMFVNSIFTIGIVFIGMNLTTSTNNRLLIIAGVSMVFGVIRALTFLPIYGARCLGLKWYTFYPVIIKNVVAVIIVTVISFGIKKLIFIDSWLLLVLASGITVLVSLAINSVIVLEKSDREFLIQKLRRILSRKSKAN